MLLPKINREAARNQLRRISGAPTLCAIILLFIAAPIIEPLPGGNFIEAVLFTLVLAAAFPAISSRRAVLYRAAALFALALITKWLDVVTPGLLPHAVALSVMVVTLLYIALHFLSFVMRAKAVNADVLCTGISAFFLITLLWACAYILVDRLVPHSYLYSAGPESQREMNGFTSLYFSLVTICSVGFGDITPISSASRSVAMFEGAAGVVFVAVFLARLVSLYSAPAPEPPADTKPQP